jgi:hypothetical protein
VGMLVQEHPIERVVRVAGLMRIPAHRHRGTACLRRSRPSRSSVRIADAFATAARPDVGLERASRRSSVTVRGSRSLPPLPLSGVIGVVLSLVFFELTHPVVGGGRCTAGGPSPYRVWGCPDRIRVTEWQADRFRAGIQQDQHSASAGRRAASAGRGDTTPIVPPTERLPSLRATPARGTGRFEYDPGGAIRKLGVVGSEPSWAATGDRLAFSASTDTASRTSGL